MQAISARFLEDLRDALREHEVRYLFIGKGAAIIQGFVDTTQDADLFVDKSPENAERLISALRQAGAAISSGSESYRISDRQARQRRTCHNARSGVCAAE